MITKDLGAVSAYAYAVEKGYTGTEAEYAELMASYATVAQQASQSAQTAIEKAQQASASATSASQSADTASASATSAQTAQQTATVKASEAQQSAQTATTKAQEASQSASESSQSAQTAVQAKQDAQTAETASETAQASAESARDDAESARDTAQQYAESIDPQKLIGAYPTDTATGSIASFTDGADNIPMKSVKVRIEPVQDLSHGDPSPDNICPISGWTGANVSHSGADTSDATVYSITFPSEVGTVYGGTLDVTTGVLMVDRTMVDLGTLTFAPYDSINKRWNTTIATMKSTNERSDKLWSDRWKALITAHTGNEGVMFSYLNIAYFYTQDSNNTPTGQLCYELATPITITLTPQEIKTLLGNNNIWADAGESAVIYRADTTLYINRKIAEAISALS